MTSLKTNIKNKIIISTGIMVVLVVVVGIVGWLSSLQMRKSARIIEVAQAMKIDILECRREEKNLIIRGYVQEHYDKWIKAMDKFNSRINLLIDFEAINKDEKTELEKGSNDFTEIFNKFVPDIKIGALPKEKIDKYDNEFKVFGRRAIEVTDNVVKKTEATVNSLENRTVMIIIILTLISFVIGIIIPLYLIRLIIKPLKELIVSVTKVFTVKVEKLNLKSKDEIEELAVYLTEISEKQKNLALSILERMKSIHMSSDSLMLLSEHTVKSSGKLLSQTSEAARSSEEISTNVNTVASASEEMASSIQEIAKNTNISSQITKEAQNLANDANEVMNRLGNSSIEIGNIIKVINSIAAQTNLLALNATIESARAGEYGKGFAVVANEVKELAKESAKSTEDITHRIKMMQDDSNSAIKVISEIIETMKKINDIANTIASAVEEQSATVSEVNRNLSEASRGINTIAGVNTGVSQAASEYSNLLEQINISAIEVQKLSDDAENDVKKRFNL